MEANELNEKKGKSTRKKAGNQGSLNKWNDANSENRDVYRTGLDAIDDIIHIVDENLQVVMYNKTFASAAAVYSTLSVPYTNASLFDVFPFLKSRIREEYETVFRTGKPLTTIEKTILNDQEHWTETRKIPILDESGQIRQVVTIVRDMTDIKETESSLRKVLQELESQIAVRSSELKDLNTSLKSEIKERQKTQKALVESRERLAAQFRAIPIPTYTWRFNGNHFILDAFNDAAIEITNGGITSFLGSTLNEMYENEPDIIKDMHSCLSNEKSVVREMSYRFKSTKKDRILSVKYAYVPPDSVMVHTEDVTEKRMLEEDIQKAHKLESIGVLAGGIAHDFNNILMGILGYLEIAKYHTEKDTAGDLALAKAEKATLQAKMLTRQLLTFATGGAPVKKLSDLGELVKESAQFSLQGSNVQGIFNIADHLWPVEVDQGQINQVVNNLVLNSIQAMPDGGQITISVENLALTSHDILPLEKSHHVKVSIKDEGIGIDPGNLNNIFDPYFSTKESGSGLGLAIAFSIINKHKGYITFESDLNKGTVFTFFLPAYPDRELTIIEDDEPALNRKSHILIMDDEDIVREVLTMALEELGCTISQAEDGQQAIDTYIREHQSGTPFDVVIMDLVVPGGMGGLEAFQVIKSFDPGVCCIVFSGYSNNPVMAEHKKFGFKGCLRKPFKINTLIRMLNNIME
jgi:PAS domain S-box-containing protein